MTAHEGLRAATRAAHDRLDSMFETFALTDRTDYGQFLVAHAAALICGGGDISLYCQVPFLHTGPSDNAHRLTASCRAQRLIKGSRWD